MIVSATRRAIGGATAIAIGRALIRASISSISSALYHTPPARHAAPLPRRDHSRVFLSISTERHVPEQALLHVSRLRSASRPRPHPRARVTDQSDAFTRTPDTSSCNILASQRLLRLPLRVDRRAIVVRRLSRGRVFAGPGAARRAVDARLCRRARRLALADECVQDSVRPDKSANHRADGLGRSCGYGQGGEYALFRWSSGKSNTAKAACAAGEG